MRMVELSSKQGQPGRADSYTSCRKLAFKVRLSFCAISWLNSHQIILGGGEALCMVGAVSFVVWWGSSAHQHPLFF